MAQSVVSFQNSTSGLPLSPEMASLLKQIAPSSFLDTAALGVATAITAAWLLREYTWDKPDPYRHIYYERPQAQDGFLASRKTVTRNIAQRVEELNADVVIFWGSQSGTAEGFAARLAADLRQRFRLNTLAADLSDFDASSIAELPHAKLAIFLLSTYGEGDPSDNAGPFWDWLTKQTPALASLRYAAFGLGNSQYRYYNRVVDVVDAALAKAGAQRLLPVGRADDAAGATVEDFAAWREELFAFLTSGLGLEQHEATYEPQLEVQPDDSLTLADLHLGEPVAPATQQASTTTSAIKPLNIKSAHELFTNSTRNCLHLELDLTNHPQLTYKTGDHLAVWASNPDQEVDRLLRILDRSSLREEPLLVRALDPAVTKVPVPSPTTLEALLRHYLEICAPVARDTVRALAEFAPGPAAKAFILDLSSSREKYAAFVAANHLNIGRLLELAAKQEPTAASCCWSSLPLAFLIETLPRMQPRYYSISSSSVIAPRTAALTVLVSNTVLAPQAHSPESTTVTIPGLASNYLLGTPPNQEIFASIRRSRFKLPASSACPLVLVAAGTGIAPFRAFLAERARLAAMGRAVGETVLFFGCRSPDEDFLYREELEAAQAQLGGAAKCRIVVAFSRAEKQQHKREYVQDRVGGEEAEAVVRLLVDEDASFYVCGRASMAREVGKKVGELVGSKKEWQEDKVKEWMEGMKRTRKWQEDVWG